MTVKIYRYPADLEVLEDSPYAGTYTDYDEEFANLPALPKNLEKLVDSLYEVPKAFPETIYYATSPKDIGKYFNDYHTLDVENEIINGYCIGSTEMDGNKIIVPKELEEDLNKASALSNKDAYGFDYPEDLLEEFFDSFDDETEDYSYANYKKLCNRYGLTPDFTKKDFDTQDTKKEQEKQEEQEKQKRQEMKNEKVLKAAQEGDIQFFMVDGKFNMERFSYDGIYGNFGIDSMVQFDFPKKVDFSINIGFTGIKSLKGAPEYVGGDFDCSANELKDLKYSPKKVEGNFDCHNMESLHSLKGAPEYVGGDFICNWTRLNNLEGIPKYIGGMLNLYNAFSKATYEGTLNSLPKDFEVKGIIRGGKFLDYNEFSSVDDFKNYLQQKIKEDKQKNSSKETRLSKALKKISISRTAKEAVNDILTKSREELFSRGIECNINQAQKLLETYYHFNLKPDDNREDIIYYAHNIKTGNLEEVAFWLEQDNKLYIQDKKVYDRILPEVSKIISK